jgi:hypothetical protein
MPNMQRITWNGIALHGGPLCQGGSCRPDFFRDSAARTAGKVNGG